MKEVKENRDTHWNQIAEIEGSISSFYDNFFYGKVGEINTEKKEVVFQREKLYEELWTISLSKVAKKYNVPGDKLKKACEQSKIPLPTNSYWGNLYIGKKVEKDPLPESEMSEVVVSFSVRTGPKVAPVELEKEVKDYIQKKDQEKQSKQIIKENTQQIEPPEKSIYGGNLYKRETLYQEVWEKPVTKVAERYGVSDVMIHKVCKALNVPVPPRGYWAKIEAGQKLKKEPLPEFNGAYSLAGQKKILPAEERVSQKADDSLDFLDEKERYQVVSKALQLKVDPSKKKLHSVIVRHKSECIEWKKKLSNRNNSYYGRQYYNRQQTESAPRFYESFSEQSFGRVYRILDALFCAVEELGGKVEPDLSLQIRGEHVEFSFSEGQEKVSHALTKDEERQLEKYEKEKVRNKYAYEPRFKKYDYIPNGKLTFSSQANSYIRDSVSAGLEDRVGELLINLYVHSEEVRIEREKREEAYRKAEVEKKQREIRRKRYNEEVDKLKALNNAAKDYARACKIRAYVSALEKKANLTPEQLDSIEWAKKKADWYDPIISADDPIFGERDHNNPKEPEKYSWW